MIHLKACQVCWPTYWPDKYGNQLINIWLAQNGRPENSMNPIEQLCFIGTREWEL